MQIDNTKNMTPYKVACFGEVLWDILPDKTLPGGAPMNVAYHLQKLDVPVAMISAVGKDSSGDDLLKVMQGYKLVTDYVQTDFEHETGKVYATAGANNEMTYDIVQPVAWDYIKMNNPLLDMVDGPGYLVFGTLASRNAVSRETLLSLLRSPRSLVFDINLRPPHFTLELVELLLSRCDVLKINEAELALIGDHYQLPEDMEERIRALSARFAIHIIIVTLGDKGAALFLGEELFTHPGYKVTVADTIGSGDAFLAGFIHSMINKKSPNDTLAFSCALGALVASYHGGCPNYQPGEIKQLMKK